MALRNVPDSPELPPLSVTRCIDLWIADRGAAGCRPRTLTDYRATGDQLCWWLTNTGRPEAIGSIDANAVREFLGYVRAANPEGRWGRDHPSSKREASAATVHKAYRNIRAFLAFCERDEVLPPLANPMKRVTGPRVNSEQREPLTPEETQALIRGAQASGYPDRDAALVYLLLDSGMRASEVCQITVGDALDSAFSRPIIGKRGKTREVFWSQETARLLRRYARTCGGDPEEPLFITRQGRPFDRGNVHEVISDAATRGNVGRPVFPHLLRHTCALNLLRGGATLFEVQRLLGHSTLTVLRGYVRETRDDLRRAHAAASPVLALVGSKREVA